MSKDLKIQKNDDDISIALEGKKFLDNLSEPINDYFPTKTKLTSENDKDVITNPKLLDEKEFRDLNFYFLDGWEDHGRIYLFGKVPNNNTHESCCIVVENMPRNLYFIPKTIEDSPELKELHSDIEQRILEELSLTSEWPTLSKQQQQSLLKDKLPTQWCNTIRQRLQEELLTVLPDKEFRMKPVQRGYAFERPGMQRTQSSTVFKVLSSYKHRPIDSSSSGKFFSNVFGANQSPLELFLLKRKIMGPCWLKISQYQVKRQAHEKQSWCKHELRVDFYKHVRQWNGKKSKRDPTRTSEEPRHNDGPTPNIPSLTALALNIKSKTNKSKTLEPLMIAGVVLHDWNVEGASPMYSRYDSFTLLRKSDIPLPLNCEKHFQTTALQSCNKGQGVEIFTNESTFLTTFLSKVSEIDPDILLSHSLYSNELEVLRNRLHTCKITSWHRLSRMKRSNDLSVLNSGRGDGTGYYNGRVMTIGRLPVDSYILSRELSRGHTSYSLQNLCSSVMNISRGVFDYENLDKYYTSNALLAYALEHTLQDAILSLKLIEATSALSLTKQLTIISGCLWYRSLQCSKAERNEYLLMHEFHRRKYIVPDKFEGKAAKTGIVENADGEYGEEEVEAPKAHGKKKNTYSGGLVLDPKVGLYSTYILLLDFNSLYPSIIQEFNLCFTTVDRSTEVSETTLFDSYLQNLISSSSPSSSSSSSLAILPSILENLVKRRREVKNLLKDAKANTPRYNQLNIRQTALKLVANSIYGCLGFSSSRFFCKSIAALITFLGRNILTNTKAKAENDFSLDVIYGDTDSLMINSRIPASFQDPQEAKQGYEKAVVMAKKFIQSVNGLYKRLELDMDHIMARMLLLKKKKYAAVIVQDIESMKLKTEMKGLDLVRRDWSLVSKNTSEQILNKMLSVTVHLDDVLSSTYSYLGMMSEKIRSHQIPMEHFLITKSLTKSPHLYPDARSQPHVQVALRTSMRTGRQYRPGDFINYIIATTGVPVKAENGGAGDRNDAGDRTEEHSNLLADRAVSLEELIQYRLTIDVEWYLTNQILSPIVRLYEPLNITTSNQLAECMGIKKYYSSGIGGAGGSYDHDREAENDMEDLTMMSIHDYLYSKERYKNVTLPVVSCPSKACSPARRKIPLEYLLENKKCVHCQITVPCSYIANQLMVIFHLYCNDMEKKRMCPECHQTSYRYMLDRHGQCPHISCQQATAATGSSIVPVSTLSRKNLYQQLEYIQFLVKEKKRKVERGDNKENGVVDVEEHRDIYSPQEREMLFKVIRKFDSNNNYKRIDLSALFAYAAPTQSMKIEV